MKYIFESTLLLVDDNGEFLKMVTGILKREGFLHIDCAAGVREAEDYFLKKEPDLVVLDVNLPDGDGFSLMQKIRTVSEEPVLFLSARELILRISAILKRTYFPKGSPANRDEVLVLGECTADFKSGVARWADKEIPLTAKELLILRKLWENRGNIVTFDQLCQAVWEDNYFGYENTIMVHIRRLREKIEENPSRPRFLITVRGLGYKLKV